MRGLTSEDCPNPFGCSGAEMVEWQHPVATVTAPQTSHTLPHRSATQSRRGETIAMTLAAGSCHDKRSSLQTPTSQGRSLASALRTRSPYNLARLLSSSRAENSASHRRCLSRRHTERRRSSGGHVSATSQKCSMVLSLPSRCGWVRTRGFESEPSRERSRETPRKPLPARLAQSSADSQSCRSPSRMRHSDRMRHPQEPQ